MLKRTLFFTKPSHLSFKNEQLIVYLKEENQEHSVPIEDIGFMVLENPQITFTLRVIEACNANNTALLFCDQRHHPSAMLQNLDGNNIHSEVVRMQVNASQSLKKMLWKQVVISKVRNQGALLKKRKIEKVPVPGYVSRVKSGDPTNVEGAFARLYWKHLLGENFIRDRYGEPPNLLLNYGYTILRASVARAITASGMLPVFGIHHHGKYNAYCLADDLMEPYRPYVDEVVMEIFERNPDSLSMEKEDKKQLLDTLTMDVQLGDLKRPLMVAISSTTASLVACFKGEKRKLELPEFK
ncbi:MAG: type II CRISPR-associated endonuclease Cas1 [Bacteroidales bacterium]|nr:type II CRISPR-associated endonuclease Cas1 [Bacteroidales bacterium]